MMRLSFVIFAIISIGAGHPVLRAQPEARDDLDLRYANGIIAIAEHRVITVEDIRREIAPLVPEIQRQSRNEREFNQRLEELQQEVVQTLIDRVLIVKEFYKDEKRRIPPSFVDNQISEIIITQFDGDRSKFLAHLRERGISQREYRREVEEDIIYQYMRGQMRRSQSVVSPMRVQRFYDENRDRFYQEDAVHLRMIQLQRRPAESDEELLTRATQLLIRIRAGEDFAELAREHSSDPRRNRGGDWGWQNRSDLRPEFSEVLFTMEPGEYSEPLLTGNSAYLFHVPDRQQAGIQPIEKVRDQIERILVSEMAREAQDRWLERLRRDGYVKYF